MSTEINRVNLNAAEMFDKLDAKDGKADNKIQASIWNEFAETAGGNKINNCILKENALKSIQSYLKRASEGTKEAISNLLGQSKPAASAPATVAEEVVASAVVSEAEVEQETEEKISVENKNANQIFDELDAKDGKKDGIIKAAAWNEFAQQVGGKTIKFGIEKENAVKTANSSPSIEDGVFFTLS